VDVPRQRWQWPLAPEPAVARRFERPASTWGPGHRGVDLSASSGRPVLAVAAGRVVHVGVIAGRGTVSVLHAGGVRTTYEPVTPRVRRGQVVHAGQVIGLVDGSAASHCGGCLHLGALRGRVYLDPLALLRPGHVVLLPLGTG
jgi:murein DD-endopeptidase MepM/ murein hydrolase activator NlpD